MSGFIERLKREQEAGAKEELARREHKQREAAKTEERRRQLKKQETQLHEQRKRLAEQFHQESGVGSLLKRLKEIVPESWAGSGVEFPRELSWGEWKWDSAETTLKKFGAKDVDSVFDTFKWNKRRKHSGSTTYYHEDYFVVETTPDGMIHFHAGWLGLSSVARSQLHSNKLVLEKALEKAYHHPRTKNWEQKEPGKGPM